MSQTTIDVSPAVSAHPPETFAEVASRLGDVPFERIVWLPRTATEEDAVRQGELGAPVELIDGFLVEKAMGFRESLLASLVIAHLVNWVRPRKLGLVGAPDALVRLSPGLIRLPDVSYISWDRLRASGAHRQKVAALAPELAVEILSESNTKREIDRKRQDLFAAGTRMFWVIDPKLQRAESYADPENPDTAITLGPGDVLDGGAVLPGFQLGLGELFADLEPPPE